MLAFTAPAVALALLIVILLWRRRQQARNLPPGPTSTWSGTALPATRIYKYYYDLSKQYGPVITIWHGSKPTVICNDFATYDFLMEKHARDTADRPPSFAAADHLWGKRILLVGHGDRWRKMRKAFHTALNPNASRMVRPIQEKAAREAILDILHKPEDFQDHIHTYTASLTVNMAYGRTDRASYADPDIKLNVECGYQLARVLRPGTFMIHSFPWLQYFPGYMKEIQGWADAELNLFRKELKKVQDNIRTGKPQPPCFATYLLEHQKELELRDDDIACLCGSIFGAGSDTSSAALAIFIMAAASFPDAQARVTEELDRIFGDTPPTFADLETEETPLLRAFIAETFRWRPVSAGGFPHRTTDDLVYQGYVIPKGTYVQGNHWGISRDPAYYGDNVEEFDMDRWLSDGKLKEKMKTVQFGFGRRVCPGQHVANNSVLINAALYLWAFKISKKVVNGKEIDIDINGFTDAANVHPLPFQVSFTPRHDLESILEE